MRTIALLFAPPAGPDGELRVGGVSLLERQRRAAMVAKCDAVVVFDDVSGLLTALAEDDRVLVLAPGLVADERILSAVLAADAPALAVWPVLAGARGVERLDAGTLAAGVGVYPGAMVRRIAAGLGDWELHATLLRAAAADPAAVRLDLAALDTYAPARRRRVPLIWGVPVTAAEASGLTSTVLQAAQKGCLDWPARFLHPPVEDALVRLLLPTPVTPNQVTVVVALIGIAAGVAFAYGWLWTGLLLALLSGPLDGVDGKLARTKLEFSRFGDLEHVLDKLCEYGWYLALAGHFAFARGESGPWAVAAVIVLFALAEAVQGEFYRRFTGSQLDDAGEFERRFRLVSGRRNTFFWTLLPFAAFGAWYAGFVIIAGYAVVTFFVMQFRLFFRLQQFGRAHSSVIEANFLGTAYGFLPGAKRSAR